jgi:hypothetical protein
MAPCRYSEKLIGFSYKEKTFNGIQTCLRKPISESELFYLDDTLDHTDLINKLELGKGYIQTSRYNIKIKNSKIAEIFIKSFSKDFFNINNILGSIFLRAFSRMEDIFIKNNPRSFKFNPLGTESEKKLIELLTKSLSHISPKVNNRSKDKMGEKDVIADVKNIRTALNLNNLQSSYMVSTPAVLNTAAAYGQTLQGGGNLTRKMKRKVHEAR